MTYTIAQAAEKSGLSAHTLRFYDKEGLLPYVDRSPSGIRKFKDSDFEWLHVITCMKSTGMPIKKIKEFVDLCMKGDSTLEARLEIIRNHKKDVEKQMSELQKHLETIDYKLGYYEKALEAGSEAVHSE